MVKKPICLIVDDKPDELKYLEKMLTIDYKVIFARNLDDAISNYGQNIAIALVDVNLIEFAQDSKIALGLLQSLKDHHIPAIAITNGTDETTVRDAFYQGEVHYLWFKAKDRLSDLLNAIKQTVYRTNLEISTHRPAQPNTTRINNSNNDLIKQVSIYVVVLVILLVISFSTIGLLTWSAAKIVPENMLQSLIITILSSGMVLFILTIGGFGLLIKRITGKQFREIVKDLLNIIKPPMGE